MHAFIRRHPFLLLGWATLALFFIGAAPAVLRVLIVPMYAIWLLIDILSYPVSRIGGAPGGFGSLLWSVKLAAGLVPYILADLVLAKWRERRHRVHVS